VQDFRLSPNIVSLASHCLVTLPNYSHFINKLSVILMLLVMGYRKPKLIKMSYTFTGRLILFPVLIAYFGWLASHTVAVVRCKCSVADNRWSSILRCMWRHSKIYSCSWLIINTVLYISMITVHQHQYRSNHLCDCFVPGGFICFSCSANSFVCNVQYVWCQW